MNKSEYDTVENQEPDKREPSSWYCIQDNSTSEQLIRLGLFIAREQGETFGSDAASFSECVGYVGGEGQTPVQPSDHRLVLPSEYKADLFR